MKIPVKLQRQNIITFKQLSGMFILITPLLTSPVFADINPSPDTMLEPVMGAEVSDASDNSTANIPKSRGQLLYENHCIACHESNVHIRGNRKAKSIDDIRYWAARWSTHLELNWSADELTSVINYLNATYYQFERK